MKKIFFTFSLLLLIVLANNTKAAFFDNWFNSLKAKPATTTTDIKNIKVVKDEAVCFDEEMSIGTENLDVKNLQQFLYSKGWYKEGLITGYFGPLTKKAVINFQNTYFDEILKPLGLSKATGYVGEATLQKINNLTMCGANITKNNTNLNINKIPVIGFVTTTTRTVGTTTTSTTIKSVEQKIDKSDLITDDNTALCINNLLDEVENQTCGDNSDCQVVDHYCINKTNIAYQNIWEKLYTRVSKEICSNANVNLPFSDYGDRCECLQGKCLPVNDDERPMICGDGFCTKIENRELLYRWAEKRTVDGDSIWYPISPKENEYYCEKDCKKPIIEKAKRYSCSAGECVENSTGAFLTRDCNNMCSSNTRYACNSKGVCEFNVNGPYTTDNCNNECKLISSTGKLLEEKYYNKSKVSGKVWYTSERIGDLFRDTFDEDKQYYPRMKITDPISYKSSLTLNMPNFPSKPVKGCFNFGWIVICLGETTPERFGYELIDSSSKLNKYFKVTDNSVFSSDFFEKNILVFVYSIFLDEPITNCKKVTKDFKVDRVVYNVPDLDEIYAIDDTTPYNYQLPKYDTVIVKVNRDIITDNQKKCALKCKSTLDYYFDAVAIPKTELQKTDGTYKKINVELEGNVDTCYVVK